MKQVVLTKNAPAPIGPYSQAVIVDNLVFLSGQIPVNPATGDIADGMKGQTRQVMENLKAVLTEAGLTCDDVVKTTVFLRNIRDFAAMNEIYGEYFGSAAPARSCVEVVRLPKDVLIEVEAIAKKN